MSICLGSIGYAMFAGYDWIDKHRHSFQRRGVVSPKHLCEFQNSPQPKDKFEASKANTHICRVMFKLR